MPSVIFNSTITKTVDGSISFATDLFHVMLMSDDYRPDKKRHSRRADVADAEVNGTGYQSGGNAVLVEINNDGKNNRIDIALGGSIWEEASIRARGAVYYKANGDELIAYIDFGGEVASTNGTFELTGSTLRIQN